ncbi:MAG: PhoPQ-activated pathogenicity [Phycisphaerae bacterium]|nr:PhoPQ-activated pathogenicity [Phycisphaerae bacterium]
MRVWTFLSFMLLSLVGQLAVATDDGTHALDRYTAELDESFAWRIVQTYEPMPGTRGFAVDLTSQTWRSEEEVSHPAWTHMMQVVVPPVVEHDTALLVIGGGRRREEPPARISGHIARISSLTRSVVVLLPTVPNQPLELRDDGKKRYEDDLLAESWQIAMAERDTGWVIHQAMAKSAVAGMTATQQLMESIGDGPAVTGFVLTGGSKRGWTTWLTAAVDDRVRGIVPMVIDTINLPEVMKHHWGAYGFWAPAIGDYAGRGFAKMLTSPRFESIRGIVDPYTMRDRLTMPKLLVNAGGDQYFLPDSTKYYFDDLPGPTYLRVVPNVNHSIDDRPDVLTSALAFHDAVARGHKLPSLSWEVGEAANTLRLQTSTEPAKVLLWEATNPEARDFRLETIGAAWTFRPLRPEADGSYLAAVEAPETGFRAFLIEATFPAEGFMAPHVFTTEVQVIPDVLPFADKPME